MLYRLVVAGSLVGVTTAHAEPRLEGVIGNGGVGARYLHLDERMFVDAQATGDLDQQGAALHLGLARFDALALEHEVVAGVAITRAAAGDEPLASDMPTHTPISDQLHRRSHRFLAAYINDTVRFIRGLDVTSGLVVEQWRNLGGDSTITYGSGPPMVDETPYTGWFVRPTFGVNAQISDSVSLIAQTVGGTYEIGPSISAGRFTAQARAFTSPNLGDGVIAEASVQPVAPLIATIGYARTATVERATTLLTLTDPEIANVTGRVDTDSHIDALIARRIHGGISGFIGVDNLLDRRTDEASPRLVHAGVRGYFFSGTP